MQRSAGDCPSFCAHVANALPIPGKLSTILTMWETCRLASETFPKMDPVPKSSPHTHDQRLWWQNQGWNLSYTVTIIKKLTFYTCSMNTGTGMLRVRVWACYCMSPGAQVCYGYGSGRATVRAGSWA